jgi:hypothetical protein
MTLNVTVIGRDRCYQASDFRLTNGDTGALVTDASNKAILIQNTEFHGLLTYTGVGMYRDKHTSDWAAQWLQDIGDASVEEVLRGIADRASDWLERIRRLSGTAIPHMHTFVLATFARARAELSVISNYQTLHGPVARTASARLLVSRARATATPQVYFTGWTTPIDRTARRRIAQYARANWDRPQSIRQALMDLNDTTSKHMLAAERISPGCSVISLSADGNGFQDLTPNSPTMLRQVAFGQATPSMDTMLAAAGMKGHRPVSVSFQRFDGSSAATTLTCQPTIVQGSTGYAVSEIVPPGSARARALSVSLDGHILVDSYTTERPGEQHLFLYQADGEDYEKVPVVNLGSEQASLLEDGTVVGGSAPGDGTHSAFAWSQADGFRYLERMSGIESTAVAGNRSGLIVGHTWPSGSTQGQLAFRPALWSPSGEMLIVDPIPADYGQAIGVTQDGIVLLWLVKDNVIMTAVRHPDGVVMFVGGTQGRRVIPTGITSDGTILAAIDTTEGRIPLIATVGGDWSRLNVVGGWAPSAVAEGWTVAGYLTDKRFMRPWVMTSDGMLSELPYYADHHCQGTAINSSGTVVGTAGTDHGVHALKWSKARS